MRHFKKAIVYTSIEQQENELCAEMHYEKKHPNRKCDSEIVKKLLLFMLFFGIVYILKFT